MKILFASLFFLSSQALAVVPQMSCERTEAIREAAFQLSQEKAVSVEKAETLAREQGGPSEELTDLLFDCRIQPSLTVDLLDEFGEEEKSCKTALDDYSKSKSMTAALPAVIIGGAMILGLTACDDSGSGSSRPKARESVPGK